MTDGVSGVQLTSPNGIYLPRMIAAIHKMMELAAMIFAKSGASSPGPICSTDRKALVQ